MCVCVCMYVCVCRYFTCMHVCVYIYKFSSLCKIYNCATNKVNVAQGVGNRKQCLQWHFFKEINSHRSFYIPAGPSLLTFLKTKSIIHSLKMFSPGNLHIPNGLYLMKILI